MGHLWSKQSERETPEYDETYGGSIHSARDVEVTEIAVRASQGTAASSPTTNQNEGYGHFLVKLKSLLTRSHAEQLATWFGYSPANMDKINRSDFPSSVFVQLMDERGEISPSDISKLTEALAHSTVGLGGVAEKVKEAFMNYRPTFQPAHAKEEFFRELRNKYVTLYNAVQPIPYIRDRLFCVDKVFVEGGIEYLTVNNWTKDGKTWVALTSYKDMFNDRHIKSVRRILEGEPGFGKSTLTLQVAYDWCNGTPGSVSDKYEVLILLRLKQLGGVKSVFEAIQRFILPKDSSLNVSNIEHILKESKSVLVILDGFDEYPDRDSEETSDVWSIIKMDMFQAFDVILTTRTACLPKEPAPQTRRVRLTGFDDRARDEYIRKAVVGHDEEAATAIKRRLRENPILADLCQMPLLFVMYAHMSHERKDLEKFKSVTSFFRYMIWCFHHHMKNKMKDDNVERHSAFEDDHHELDKVAFEGLYRKDQQLLWDKKELCKRLGEDFYAYYVRLGIFVEEDVLDIKSAYGTLTASNIVREKTEVRFYHKLFCEWYAAHYLSSYAEKGSFRFMGIDGKRRLSSSKLFGKRDITKILQDLDPFDLQYVFRFACGLNPDASVKIIEYLKKKDNAQNFAVLCILEQEGNINIILDFVRELCSKMVQINTYDTLLLQRSTIQLLDVAFTNEISVAWLDLLNCNCTMDLHDGMHLQLQSNLSIPVLITLEKLTIRDQGRKLTSEEFTGILQYSSKCLALTEVRFDCCMLPQFVQDEDECISVLRSRDVKVMWSPTEYIWYQLNLQSFFWEDEYVFTVMTSTVYKEQERKFQVRYGE